ncbi:hypothetical protein SAMN05192554_10725 [Haloarchaeobius iranensis]|uniref:Uncharacterized protein n=1 Tax=Haloarchaeobius iranensis TaxID=996166 RepID=A0A1G9VVC8_9EURY|nr:hypothetical protein SAMN05192554_10725 [Haloarchaeobius iranensis]
MIVRDSKTVTMVLIHIVAGGGRNRQFTEGIVARPVTRLGSPHLTDARRTMAASKQESTGPSKSPARTRRRFA